LSAVVFSRLSHLLLAVVSTVAAPGFVTAATMSAEIGFLHVQASLPGRRFRDESSDFPRPYYDVVAQGGTGFQSAVYVPTIAATFNPNLDAPGTTVIQFQPPSGRYAYEFFTGFSAELGIQEPFRVFVEEGLTSAIDIAGVAGALPIRRSDSDADTLGVPFGIPGFFGITFGYTQVWMEEFNINFVRANIVARHRRTGTTRLREVVLQGGVVAPIDLDLPGIWDFSLTNFAVNAAIDREITLGAGVGVDYLVGSDDFLAIPAKTTITRHVLSMQPVAEGRFQNWFEINVVPEPAAWLMTVSLLALTRACRGRGRERTLP
jgi:hypothetical protein